MILALSRDVPVGYAYLEIVRRPETGHVIPMRQSFCITSLLHQKHAERVWERRCLMRFERSEGRLGSTVSRSILGVSMSQPKRSSDVMVS